MAGNLFVFPRAIAFDVGVVQPGAKITFTATGTTDPQNTYTNIGLTVASSNPVVADAEGLFAPIYLDPTLPDYRVKYTDFADALIYQEDDVPASQSGQSLTLTDTAPFIDLIETDAAANNTSWRIQVNSEQLTLQLANDALAAFTDILTIDRTANTVDAIALKGASLSSIGPLSNTGTLTTDGPLTTALPVFITETSAASPDVTGDGQYWVKDDAPNIPKFTDDDGTDHDLVISTFGTFTGTLTGFDGADPTATIYYSKRKLDDTPHYLITIWIIAAFDGTSDTTSMTITGLPAAITPTSTGGRNVTDGQDSTAPVLLQCVVTSSNVIIFSVFDDTTGNFDGTGFTASGTKGLFAFWHMQYVID